MKKWMLPVVLTILLAGASAANAAVHIYRVKNVGLGDTLDKVFKVLGPPQAVQRLDSDDSGAVQLLYFQKEDTLSINLSDLPDNKVVQMEVSGLSWPTETPVQVGEKLDRVIAKVGKPDKIDDLTQQKQWMLEQAGDDSVMRHLIERNSGDSAILYQSFGLYMEYDKGQRLIKSIRIFNPISKFIGNINKL